MTPKEKAFIIIQRMGQVPFNFDGSVTLPFKMAKQYALAAVDFLIEDEEMHTNGEINPIRFWRDVKIEIKKHSL